jgi:uncharacterized membrane protein
MTFVWELRHSAGYDPAHEQSRARNVSSRQALAIAAASAFLLLLTESRSDEKSNDGSQPANAKTCLALASCKGKAGAINVCKSSNACKGTGTIDATPGKWVNVPVTNCVAPPKKDHEKPAPPQPKRN